ncbi:M14 family zinc carboxypeptidase [Solicola gregarius]|uniref:Peptidase M14 domain-containing protein n=1 Tax=Solicola gregarius TaxID=2908642 RepID=A0AA46TG84_9ACTN|nr:M14 family zinc carboxypeptidase [Solicola gregarius]UYM04690.1 hypothetical protein L0C25_19460 [Solicola gregarius]
MGRIRIGVATMALLAGGGVVAAGTTPGAADPPSGDAARKAACGVLTTTPRYAGDVPSPQESLGFELGSHQTTVRQLYKYMNVIDRSSDKVVSGTAGRTATGTPLKYALLSTKGNVKPARLRKIASDAAKLRDPSLPRGQAKAIQKRMPAILWLTGNVHGDEAAAGDAGLQIMYELADRTDCVAKRITDNALVGFIPSQNPDGRTADTRENSYAFDMNRDWFSQTQPETNAKLDLLRKYPPQLFIDEHGMGGDGYFFPPNTDPTYHETSSQSVGWINNLYGAANAASFTAEGLDFETYESGYDLFFQGYGDSVPTTQFGAAGMTFEVGQDAAYPDQTYKHYLSGISSLYAGATHRKSIVTDWHKGYVQAERQGRQCRLEPNEVYNPGNTVQQPVPSMRVCGYFLSSGTVAKKRDLAVVVQRLQDAGVKVYRLTKPVHVSDFTEYGRTPDDATMQRGTYWIPMDQAEKHWVQAMLNENTYVPFPYFYDVSGWSMALLSNLEGGYTGTKVQQSALAPLPRQKVGPMPLPQKLPEVGVLSRDSSPFRPSQSAGWLRWRLDRDWEVPNVDVRPSQVSESTLSGLDTLIVPDTDAERMADLIGAEGADALRTWVDQGGHLIGWQGGTELAAQLGLSTAVLTEPTGQAPGTLFRTNVSGNSPLTKGVGSDDWVMYDSDPLMAAGDPADVVAAYPAADSDDWYVSGYQEGAEELGETAFEVSEPVGSGDVTVFASDPNFRAFSDGTARLLYNAILTSRGTQARQADLAPRAESNARAADVERARGAASRLDRVYDPAVAVRVADADVAAATDVLRGHGADVRVARSGDTATVYVPAGRRASADPAGWVRDLPAALEDAGVEPLSIDTP